MGNNTVQYKYLTRTQWAAETPFEFTFSWWKELKEHRNILCQYTLGKHFPRLCQILQSSFLHPNSLEVFKTLFSSFNYIFMLPKQIHCHGSTIISAPRPTPLASTRGTDHKILVHRSESRSSGQNLCSWCHLQRLITVPQGPQRTQNRQAEAQIENSRTAALSFFILLPTKVIP